MTEKGKSLETTLHRWLTELDIYFHRFYDSKSFGRVGTARPSDFWCYLNNRLILIECKEHKGKSLPFNAFQPSQYKGYFKAVKHDVLYIALVHFTDEDLLYAVKMCYIVDSARLKERKSMPISFFIEKGNKIEDKNDLLLVLKGVPL